MPRLSRPACSCLTDQFDAGNIECFNQCHERVDIPADHAVARFYPLNGPEKKVRPFNRLALVDPQESPRSPRIAQLL